MDGTADGETPVMVQTDQSERNRPGMLLLVFRAGAGRLSTTLKLLVGQTNMAASSARKEPPP